MATLVAGAGSWGERRLLELFLLLPILIVALPIMALIAFALLIEGGPVIFKHRRVSRAGEFNCLKFRTMRVDAKDALDRLLERDPASRAEWLANRKLKNDPRVTRLGRILRRLSLDELPQIWNVMRGEMALVGPRPVCVDELACYGADVCHYLSVKPGMTGLWQVSGRSSVCYDHRIALDREYALTRSLSLDLMILAKTVPAALGMRGAV